MTNRNSTLCEHTLAHGQGWRITVGLERIHRLISRHWCVILAYRVSMDRRNSHVDTLIIHQRGRFLTLKKLCKKGISCSDTVKEDQQKPVFDE